MGGDFVRRDQRRPQRIEALQESPLRPLTTRGFQLGFPLGYVIGHRASRYLRGQVSTGFQAAGPAPDHDGQVQETPQQRGHHMGNGIRQEIGDFIAPADGAAPGKQRWPGCAGWTATRTRGEMAFGLAMLGWAAAHLGPAQEAERLVLRLARSYVLLSMVTTHNPPRPAERGHRWRLSRADRRDAGPVVTRPGSAAARSSRPMAVRAGHRPALPRAGGRVGPSLDPDDLHVELRSPVRQHLSVRCRGPAALPGRWTRPLWSASNWAGAPRSCSACRESNDAAVHDDDGSATRPVALRFDA